MVRNVQSLKLSKDHLMVSRPGQIARLLSDQSALGLFKPPHLCPVAQTAWLAYMMSSYLGRHMSPQALRSLGPDRLRSVSQIMHLLCV